MKKNFENSKIDVSYLSINNKRKVIKKLIDLGFKGDIESLVENCNYLYTISLSINYGISKNYFESYHAKEISPYKLLKNIKHKLK